MNQKGFATLEIILAVAIISLLTFVAVPKIDKVMDKIFLDYEVKRFCSELDFARSLSRSANFEPEIFSGKITSDKSEISFSIEKNSNSYQLKKNIKFLRDKHYLGGCVKINYPASFATIKFSAGKISNAKSGTIILTSRLGEEAEIIFDSVGRWRGNKNVE